MILLFRVIIMPTVCVNWDVLMSLYSTLEAPGDLVVNVVAGYQNVAGSIITISTNITNNVIKIS
jgi:hypothetical protein